VKLLPLLSKNFEGARGRLCSPWHNGTVQACYSQRAVFASLWALFFIITIIIKWWWREIWATVIHLVSSGDLGVVTHQISDDLGMTSTGGPRQARHVMLRRHGNSSSSSRDHSLIHDCTRRIF